MASPPPRARGPKRGRPQGSFTQHRRLEKLRRLLEDKPGGVTLAELAAGLRVTPRSVHRYLRALDGTREGRDLETLESVETTPGGAHVWRIKPGERGRAVALRRAQAYGILATRRALDVLRGSALFDEIDLALGQISKLAQTPFRSSGKGQISGDSRLEERFFVLPPASRSYAARGEDLDELFRAVADLRVVRYRPRGRAQERTEIHPYAMVVHRGALFIVGFVAGARPGSAGAMDALVVPFESMTEIRTSETEQFELPDGFELTSYLHGEFGVAPPVRARFTVEFDARVADEIRARRLHPQQKIFAAPDGRVRVSIPLVDRAQAIAWTLSWGDAARVVEPAELSREVSEILARAAARYGA
jgi:predicted DNA-binding transcriptional regulator YafY